VAESTLAEMEGQDLPPPPLAATLALEGRGRGRRSVAPKTSAPRVMLSWGVGLATARKMAQPEATAAVCGLVRGLVPCLQQRQEDRAALSVAPLPVGGGEVRGSGVRCPRALGVPLLLAENGGGPRRGLHSWGVHGVVKALSRARQCLPEAPALGAGLKLSGPAGVAPAVVVGSCSLLRVNRLPWMALPASVLPCRLRRCSAAAAAVVTRWLLLLQHVGLPPRPAKCHPLLTSDLVALLGLPGVWVGARVLAVLRVSIGGVGLPARAAGAGAARQASSPDHSLTVAPLVGLVRLLGAPSCRHLWRQNVVAEAAGGEVAGGRLQDGLTLAPPQCPPPLMVLLLLLRMRMAMLTCPCLLMLLVKEEQLVALMAGHLLKIRPTPFGPGCSPTPTQWHPSGGLFLMDGVDGSGDPEGWKKRHQRWGARAQSWADRPQS